MQNMNNGNRSIVYDGKIAGLYDLEETLGSGHFAVVKLARHVFTGEKVAVKVIDKTKLDEVSRAHLFQEVRCMKLVQHPNVVRLYQVIDTQTKLYLILELGDGGDLYDYIMKHEGGLSENLAREYFRQIVRAISYCHQLHVVHRDLKPENVVFFEKLGVVKLTDFGFSNKFCPGQKLETSCGSLAYSAPEILLGDSYDAPAVDVWSLGVILYMLVCGQPPFEKANDSETLTMIMDCKYTMPAHVSQGCRNLISSMLVRAPEKRSTLEEIAKNEWLVEGANDNVNVPEYLPLISRQQVSDDDHNFIIQKIINGKIAAKEEILDALDRNEYSHITATYFLLAEKKLRQKRQEQIQKRRPEFTLPVSSSSRSSSKSRAQNIQGNLPSKGNAGNRCLIVPVANTLCPRTPGAETTMGGRTRKCSIVQEEDDDEDELPSCSKQNDLLVPPLNRRGSRSEGRINLALQTSVVAHPSSIKTDCTNLSTIIKNPTPSSSKQIVEGIENISGIEMVNSNIKNIRIRLGGGGIGATQYHRSVPPIEVTNKNNTSSVDTKILTDSSTITIPICSTTVTEAGALTKFKTMPSPIRPSGCQLNEIFEEGTDIGSSDTSTTTTPRPIIRSAHFTRNLTTTPAATHPHNHHHRRTKFHKTRTPSCSSSEASDDDSESKKKRAHKISDLTKSIHQRRDSYDDSSDSQDQGASASGNQNTARYYTNASNSNSTNVSQNSTEQGKGTTQDNNSSTNRQRTDLQETKQSIQFRRRRRTSETTRLRESQSLNRITEVQESELPNNTSQLNNNNSGQEFTTSSSTIKGQIDDDEEEILNNVNISREKEHNAIEETNITSANRILTTKPKSFGARLFHGFLKNKTAHDSSQDNNLKLIFQNNEQKLKEGVDIVLGVELAKQLRVSSSTNTEAQSKPSTAAKKLKMLGKYFQVHKKICIPLPFVFQRNANNDNQSGIGRLYKAQSCGNVDRVNQIYNAKASKRHSVLLNDKNSKILLKKYLSKQQLRQQSPTSYFNHSDSDINQNMDKLVKSSSMTESSLKPTKISLQQERNQLILNSSDILISTLDIKSVSSTPSSTSKAIKNVNNKIISPHATLALSKSKNFTLNQEIKDVPLCSSKC